MDPGILIRPASPATPFEFPFVLPGLHQIPDMDEGINVAKPPMGSVTRVVGLPCVYGLRGNKGSMVKVTHAAVAMDAINNPSLMDGGANICLTGILDLLVDVITIPPLPITVATKSDRFLLDVFCTKCGLLPLTLNDGLIYYQPCYYCKNATETIISPEAIVSSSNILVHWSQEGHKDLRPGSICFFSDSGLYSILLVLEKQDGPYYCPTDVFTIDRNPVWQYHPTIGRVAAPDAPPWPQHNKRYHPVTRDHLTEIGGLDVTPWLPREDQLDLLPGNVTGIPPGFQYHPFCFVDWKEEAQIQKQTALWLAERTTKAKKRYYMDFRFMWASTLNYAHPNKKHD